MITFLLLGVILTDMLGEEQMVIRVSMVVLAMETETWREKGYWNWVLHWIWWCVTLFSRKEIVDL